MKEFDKRLGNKLIPKEIKVTSVVEVTYEIESDVEVFNREVKDYYKDNEFVGRVDPMNQFDKIL
ncbi:hypothetical protein HV819_02080 [Anaerococcus sp. AGMB00486]|uniref:Uncharacterized protein n=2 Tax=Anaerococcus TaxID=165779 RepID=A0ABX2N7X3_9FIRM|nr:MULTISPECIES: hypothetical protein [Anaerococcus]MSS77413.1 hypothetical protein [Anaerococcus porci]NVF10787.1 hypothetical protein [Anaerococcus faecalis]